MQEHVSAKENRDFFISDKAAYIHENPDREKWSHMLDEQMFDRFVALYDEHMTD